MLRRSALSAGQTANNETPDLSQRDPDELLPEAATTHPTQQHRPFIVHGSKNPPSLPLMNRTYFRMFFFVAKVPV